VLPFSVVLFVDGLAAWKTGSANTTVPTTLPEVRISPALSATSPSARATLRT